MRCRGVRGRLSTWLDGDLPSATGRAVSAHLSTCAACGRRAEQLASVSQLFEELPLVFQYNKRDLSKTIAPLATLNTALNPEDRPWFESVASKKQGILEPLQEVTKRVLQELRFEA